MSTNNREIHGHGASSPDQLLASDDCVPPVDGIYLVNTNLNHFNIVNGIHADTSPRSMCDTQEDCKHNDMNITAGTDTIKLSMCEDQYNALKKHCTTRAQECELT